MSIILSTETQKLIEKKIQSGAFGSADAVVHAALEALDELSEFSLDESDLDAIDEAEGQIERGEVHRWEDVRDRVKARFLGKK